MIAIATWDQLLRLHVDGDGRVNYQAWQKNHPTSLSAWLALQTAETEGRQDHLAHWINLYNAFTIQAVLNRYPISSIRPSLLGLPDWIGFLRFFQQPVHRLGTELVSLAQIENRMLRQQTKDPRIHFAIVCASMGCPQLRNQAYTAQHVEQQLREDVVRFVNNPEKVRYDAAANILHCSRIFQWYRADFLATAVSIPSYILSHLHPPAAAARAEIVTGAAEPRLAYLPYDWSLNQRISS